MLDPRAFLINNKTGRVVATTFIEFLSGNSTTPSICFTDSPDSGLQCDSNGVVNYIKNGVNQGEIAASLGPGTGTVTSVGLVAPTGFSVSDSPVTTSGNITLSFAAGYSLPTTASQANWDTAYTERLYWDGGATRLNAATGRTSLGLGDSATLNIGTTTGTVAAGDDSRFIPAGGTTGQALLKTSGTDYDASWQTLDALNDLANSSYDLTGNGSVSSLDATEFTRGMTPKGDIALLNASGNAGISFLGGSPALESAGLPQLSGAVSLFIQNSGNSYCDSFVNLLPGLGANIGGEQINFFLTSANGTSSPSNPTVSITQSGITFEKSITLTASDALKYSNIPGGTTGQVLTKSSGTDYDASWQDLAVSDVFIIACSDETSDLAAGTDKARFAMPYAGTLTAVKADVNTAPTGSTLIVDINEAGTSVLSTKLSIDASETSSSTAATPAVISDSALANGAVISIDIDQIGSTVAGAGLKVTLYITRS